MRKCRIDKGWLQTRLRSQWLGKQSPGCRFHKALLLKSSCPNGTYQWDAQAMKTIRPCIRDMAGLSREVRTGRNKEYSSSEHFPWKQRWSSEKLAAFSFCVKGIVEGKIIHRLHGRVDAFELGQGWNERIGQPEFRYYSNTPIFFCPIWLL